MALGVSVYGNGGMNTTYPQGSFQCPTGPTTVAPANILCGNGTLGVDLSQLIVAPTVAYKLNNQHALGFSLLLGYQRFKITGAQACGDSETGPWSISGRATVTSGAGVYKKAKGSLKVTGVYNGTDTKTFSVKFVGKLTV